MKAQRHFNIIPLNHRNAIVEANSSLVELKFELPKSLKIHGKLHNNNQNDLDKYVKHEQSNTNSVVLTVFVTLPEEGQYGLDIYARDPEFQVEKRTMSHCCKYLINFHKKKNGSPQNTIRDSNQSVSQHQQLIGPNNEILTRLGMIPISHNEPIIKLDEVAQVDLQFKMSKAVDFSFDMKYDPNGSHLQSAVFVQLKASEIVKVKQYGYTISFSINLPVQKYGNYLFTVYASDDQNKTKNLPAVYTYLIQYDKFINSNNSPAGFKKSFK